MSAKSNKPQKGRKKLDVSPRDLPEQVVESAGQPFEQLNAAKEAEPKDKKGSLVEPRALPKRDDDDATMKEAMRLMLEEGQTREEVAKQLKIEPLQVRHWENAYHEFLQRDLNEGEYHDTDAQLRDLPESERARFNDNWDQVSEKATERRIKVSAWREKLMVNPLTRWFFSNKHGDLDWGVIIGLLVALAACVFTVKYITNERSGDVAELDGDVFIPAALEGIEHNAESAAQAVVKFHQTEKWEDKLQYVIAPDRVKPLMEKWYQEHPDEVHLDHITFVTDNLVEHKGRHFVILAVQGRNTEDSALDSRDFFMAIEKIGNKYLVDWEVSSGYQPMSMERYREEKPVTPLEFRLTFEQDNYYNFGFKEETYYCFKASYLGLNDPIFVYGRRDDPKATEINNTLDLEATLGVIAKLRYPPNAPTGDQVEMVEVVGMTWFKDYSKKTAQVVNPASEVMQAQVQSLN